MFKLIYAVSVGTILFLAGAMPVSAGNPAPPEAAVYLTLGLDTKTTSPAPHLAVYNFGDVDQGSTTPIKHQFLLKNSTASPVVVERLTVCCGCITAVPGGGASLPDVLAPGKGIEVEYLHRSAAAGCWGSGKIGIRVYSGAERSGGVTTFKSLLQSPRPRLDLARRQTVLREEWAES
jgi:hypothetical protein